MKVENNAVSSREVIETLQDANQQIRDRDDLYNNWTEKDKNAFDSLSFCEQQTYRKAMENEPYITKDLKVIVKSNGGELVGLEYRIKTPFSVYEKIYNRTEKIDISEINDLIRYTEVKDKDKLVECTMNTISQLEKSGYIVIQIKNTWLDENNPYNGINVQFKSEQGQKFELQFHTPQSFEIKNSEKMHGLYEQERVLSPDSEEYLEIEDKMFEMSEGLDIPDNINKIQNYRR